MTREQIFNRELEIFRTEEEQAAQFFYAYLGVHAVASDSPRVEDLLNTAALFWNTCLGALQKGTFIALGRIFDQHSPHNLDRLLKSAQEDLQIFSREALARRKQGDAVEKPDWVDEFVSAAYEPTAKDFRRLRAHVKKWRRIYETNYRDIRNEFFAHKNAADAEEVAQLFRKGSNREMQQLFAFLASLYETLWQLLNNGRKPKLRPVRYSVTRMRQLPSPHASSAVVQERILHEAERFLLAVSITVPDPGRPRRRKKG